MTEDPLAKFRKKPETAGAREKYEAFAGSASTQRRLWLKGSRAQADFVPSYSYLKNVVTDTWSMITLQYGIPLVVVIHGEYLGDVLKAIIEERAVWVQVFDAAKHEPPPAGAPLIREIEMNLTRPVDPPPPHERH